MLPKVCPMVDKRIHAYIRNEDILKKVKAEKSISEIVGMLLEEYYSQDLEYLKQKKQELMQEQEIIDLKIANKEKQNELIKQQKKEEDSKLQETTERKELADAVLKKWRNKEITEKEYWSFFKGGKLNIKKAKRFLKNV